MVWNVTSTFKIQEKDKRMKEKYFSTLSCISTPKGLVMEPRCCHISHHCNSTSKLIINKFKNITPQSKTEHPKMQKDQDEKTMQENKVQPQTDWWTTDWKHLQFSKCDAVLSCNYSNLPQLWIQRQETQRQCKEEVESEQQVIRVSAGWEVLIRKK